LSANSRDLARESGESARRSAIEFAKSIVSRIAFMKAVILPSVRAGPVPSALCPQFSSNGICDLLPDDGVIQLRSWAVDFAFAHGKGLEGRKVRVVIEIDTMLIRKKRGCTQHQAHPQRGYSHSSV
jgi:hypothetical protein